jgi:Transcriptional regulator
MPAYCTALGKVLTAFSSHHLEERVRGAELKARTPHTIVSPAKMLAELVRIRDQGTGYDREECALGVECVAAPVRAADGACVGAISITVPAHRLHLMQLAPVVRGAAAEASRALAAVG